MIVSSGSDAMEFVTDLPGKMEKVCRSIYEVVGLMSEPLFVGVSAEGVKGVTLPVPEDEAQAMEMAQKMRAMLLEDHCFAYAMAAEVLARTGTQVEARAYVEGSLANAPDRREILWLGGQTRDGSFCRLYDFDRDSSGTLKRLIRFDALPGGGLPFTVFSDLLYRNPTA